MAFWCVHCGALAEVQFHQIIAGAGEDLGEISIKALKGLGLLCFVGFQYSMHHRTPKA